MTPKSNVFRGRFTSSSITFVYFADGVKKMNCNKYALIRPLHPHVLLIRTKLFLINFDHHISYYEPFPPGNHPFMTALGAAERSCGLKKLLQGIQNL